MISFRERILFVWGTFMKTRQPLPVKWVMSIGGQLQCTTQDRVMCIYTYHSAYPY